MYKKMATALASGLLLGMFAFSEPGAAASRWNFEGTDLAKIKPSEISTIQRLLRRLGYPASGQPSARIRKCLGELSPTAHDFLHPRGVRRIVERGAVVAAEMPEPTDWVGVGLCTIGPELESESQRLSADGDQVGGLFGDGLGELLGFSLAVDALGGHWRGSVRV